MQTRRRALLPLATAFCTLGLAACASSQAPSPAPTPALDHAATATARPHVPVALEPSVAEAVSTRAAAKGVQIYECQAEGWKLVGPDAELVDDAGRPLGRHYAGPTWEATDGSKVVGELRQKVDAPGGQGVPWLLLKAKSTEGTGAFAKVTSIQRVDTSGGKAPSQVCDAAAVGTRQSVPYRATYYFYSGGS
jgi:hypothetical protein